MRSRSKTPSTSEVHVLAASMSLASGTVALCAMKGSRLHRKSGILFVWAMLLMSFCAAVLAAEQASGWSAVNIPAALLTAYLVATSLITVRPASAESRRLNVGLMLMASSVGLTALTFGIQALASGGNRNGVPAFAFLMFGIVGLLASAGDLRVLRSGALKGAPRIGQINGVTAVVPWSTLCLRAVAINFRIANLLGIPAGPHPRIARIYGQSDARAALTYFECGACTDWTTYTRKSRPIHLILNRLTQVFRSKKIGRFFSVRRQLAAEQRK